MNDIRPRTAAQQYTLPKLKITIKDEFKVTLALSLQPKRKKALWTWDFPKKLGEVESKMDEFIDLVYEPQRMHHFLLYGYEMVKIIVDNALPLKKATWKTIDNDMDLLQAVFDHYEYVDITSIKKDWKAQMLLQQA